MMTKDQYAKSIIQKAFGSMDKFQEGDITRSSAVAVAAEHLGLIKSDHLREYAASRGGMVATYLDEESVDFVCLSTRELLELLPDGDEPEGEVLQTHESDDDIRYGGTC